ncbi:hypothetical protein K445DRAFT_368672 [Daldinia sp. EC12]|nr:hypothetical protein K445DRAFT_368672 [Daldinia sp. EC12]
MDFSTLDLDHTPIIAPPPGVVPNFDNPKSLAPIGRITIAVVLPIMAIFVVLRFYTRFQISRSIGADDYLCLAGTAATISYCGVCLAIYEKGLLGPHQWDAPISSVTPQSIQLAQCLLNLFSVAAIFIKTSLLMLYLRIFRPSRTARAFIWLGIVLITTFYISNIISAAIFCNPSIWASTTNQIEFLGAVNFSGCRDPLRHISATQGVFSPVSDAYVLIIPIFLVSGLQLPRMRRIGIVTIFLIGLIATGSSIVTAIFRFWQLTSEDISWYAAKVSILGGVELMAGIICSCMPVVFVIFKRIAIFSWASLTQYAKTFLSKESDTTVIGTELKEPKSPLVSLKRLPGIPRATITGLKTLVRGNPRGHNMDLSELSTYNEINSVDEEYHVQLMGVQNRDSASVPLSSESELPRPACARSVDSRSK